MLAPLREKLYEHNHSSDLFPVLAYDSDHHLFVLSDTAVGFAFLSNPLNGADETTAEKINVLLNQDFPGDTILSVSLIGHRDIEYWLTDFVSRRIPHRNDSPMHNLLYESTVESSKFMRRGTRRPIENRNHTKVRDILSLITVKIPLQNPEPSELELETLGQLRRSVQQTIDIIGMKPTPVDASMYVRLMSVLLHGGDNPRWQSEFDLYDDQQLICDQVLDLDTAISVDPTGLWAGDPRNKEERTRIKVLSPKRIPKEVHINSAALYVGDPLSGTRGIRGNFLLNFNIHYPNAEQLKSKLEKRRQWATQQAGGKLVKFVPQLVDTKRSFDTMFQALDDGDRPVRLSMSLMLFADDEEEAAGAVSVAKTYYRELGYQMLEDRFFCLPIFINNLPFGADRKAVEELKRYRSLATRHVSHMLPLISEWKGTRTPVLQFVSRNGQIMNFDLFDSQSSYNCAIAAESGSGKSFLVNAMASSYLSLGAKVFIIDVGRSYEKLAKSFGGSFIEFTDESNICLNPFPIVMNYNDEVDMLATVISTMAQPSGPISDFQNSNLRRILRRGWEAHKQDLTIDIVSDMLREHEDRRIQDLGEQLFQFTVAGEYGRWFNGPNTMQFDNPFTVLELEELKGRRHLQQIVLLMLIYQINNEMYLGDRGRRKVVIIDEAWQLLTEGDVGEFIVHGYRRARKYGGAFAVATQSVNDLYSNNTGVAIAENSPNKILLGQNAETVANLKRTQRIDLPEAGYEFLKSVKTVTGVYSEMFINTGNGIGIARLIVDRFRQLLYSTKAEEVSEINKLVDSGLSITDAIHRIMARENGDEAA
ncbi:MAG: type IV secretion system protein TraC [Salinisphaeraceae bacterium]